MKLPRGVAAVLFVAHLSNQVAVYSVLGYLPQILLKFKVPQENLGSTEGLISYLITAGRTLGTIIYGPVLDRYSTAKVLSLMLLLNCVTMLAFGLSMNPTSLAVCRFCFGVTNGIDMALRVLLKEVPVDSYDVAIVFVSPTTLALSIGPTLGGLLAMPVQQYPNIFGRMKILDDMPVLLPSLVLSITYFAIALCVIFYLSNRIDKLCNNVSDDDSCMVINNPIDDLGRSFTDEAPAKLNDQLKIDSENQGIVPFYQKNPKKSRKNIRELMQTDFILISFTMVLYWSGSYGFYVIFALWLGTPESMSGMGFKPKETTNVYFVPGLVATFLDLACLGKINSFFRPHVAFYLWVLLKSFFVLIATYTGAIKDRPLFNVLVGVAIVLIRFATSGCNGSIVSALNSSVSEENVGTANAIAVSTAALISFAVSVLLGKLYSWSIENEFSEQSMQSMFPFNHYFTFYLSGLLTISAGICCSYVKLKKTVSKRTQRSKNQVFRKLNKSK